MGPRLLRAARAWGLLGLVLLVAACGSSVSGSGQDDADGGIPDGFDVIFDVAVPPRDIVEIPDVPIEKDLGDRDIPEQPDVPFILPGTGPVGEFAAPCASSDDCYSGFCVPWDEGYTCTERCLQECPPGWDCRAIPWAAPDAVFVCFWNQSFLCQSCIDDEQCGDGLCLELGDMRHCSRPCEGGDDCPTGFSCVERESLDRPGTTSMQCVPDTERCDCTRVNEGDQRICTVNNEWGECSGLQTCDAGLGWTPCSASTPAAEICDGIDSDCDGVADEGVTPPEEACENVNELGTCPGSWACRGTAGWVCSAPRAATEEVCDRIDNDCDDEEDEGFVDPATGRYTLDENCGDCGEDCTVRKPNGTMVCDGTADPPACVISVCDPGYYQAGPFTCLPVTSSLCLPCVQDENCLVPGDRCLDYDGDSFCGRDCGPESLHGETCPTGYACDDIEAGVRQCVPVSGTCECLPANDGLTRPCETSNQFGTCAGEETCNGNTGWSSCDAQIPEAESCDGEDNDCDGLIDEEATLPEEPCQTTFTDPDTGEEAVCGGTWRCVRAESGAEWVCNAETAGPELCNGRDDDCDGTTDEGFRDPTTGIYNDFDHCGACGTSCEGTVPNGTARCEISGETARCALDDCDPGFYLVNGQACLPALDPSCQRCNTDANCVVPGNLCTALDGGSFCTRQCGADNPYGTDEGVCPEGYSCEEVEVGAPLQCVPNTGSCTCLDLGDDGATRPCSRTNDAGTCRGFEACDIAAGGWQACDAAVPAVEECDGVDNDCDTYVDEDLVFPPPEDCFVQNADGRCTGDWECHGVDDWFCTAATPSAEICDGVDNNCDGATDEPFRDEATGIYNDYNNCNVCDFTCEGAVLNALTTVCEIRGTRAVCVPTECEEGFFIPANNDRVCMPEGVGVDCQPCSDSSQCAGLPGGACEDIDDGSYCTRSCTLPADCPPDYSCLGGRCRPRTASCSCLPGQDGDTRPCAVSNGFGICTGIETCFPDQTPGWSACDAAVPAEESCNGVDDDCNGLTDEGVALADPSCLVSNEFGDCPGTQLCMEQGGVTDWYCVGPDPEPEACDGADNNCDGATDETFRDAVTGRYVALEHCGTCGNSCVGRIPNATAYCNGDLATPRCEVESCLPGYYQVGTTTCLPAAETACQPCNTDANCVVPGNLCLDIDGGRFCGRQCGQDNPYGSDPGVCPEGFTCEAVVAGQPDQCVPNTSSCTCLDVEDDGDTRPCSRTNPDGTCRGFEACDIAAGGWQPCDAPVPAAEVCDGVDNDCDTYVDEDVVPPPIEDCFIQNTEGRCTGDWECHGVDDWFCTAATPIAELCDGADNDCDGATDETFRDAATGIYNDYDNCGVCDFSCNGAVLNALTTVCEIRGTTAVCVPTECEEGFFIPASNDRVCMPVGVGVDCQPCSESSQCAALPGGACEAIDDGLFCTRSCGAPGDCPADYTCTDGRCLPSSLSCSCMPGQEGTTRPCAIDNEFGSCAGIETCFPDQTPGWSACDASVPAEEICNGVDDDCNGLTDEGVALADPSCLVSNEFGDCPGTQLCMEQGGVTDWYCVGPDPEAEACDAADNDCDGATDETFRDPVTGRYVALEHCGTCGNSCIGRFPNAVAYCNGDLLTPRCEVESCLPGYYQVGTTSCLPVAETACQPCNTDANCVVPGNLCLDIDGGRFCGRQCGDGNPYGSDPGVCPEGFTCQTVVANQPDQCVPNSGSCSCLDIGDDGNTRPCSRTNADGTCRGFETCDFAAGGWQPCDAAIPAPEVCDGVDNDCDTYVDEDVVPPPIEDCFVENAEGRCTGEWECHGVDNWFCTAATPIAELCDGADNNCDGATDETFRDPVTGIYDDYDNCGVCDFSCDGAVLNALRTVCEIRGTTAVCIPTECEQGFFIPDNNDRVCMPEGVGVDCQPCSDAAQCAGLPGGDCEAIDDGFFCTRSCVQPTDCPTAYDCVGGRCQPTSLSCTCLPGQDGATRPCVAANEFGSCAGIETCFPDQVPGWSACDAQIPAAESCNGLDDDCNGLTDEGVTIADPSCFVENALGACPGTLLCREQGGVTDWYCVGPTPQADICDGLDNDCDTFTDEDYGDLRDVCFEGDGLCKRFGFRVCTADGQGTECNAIPGPSSTEICDGLDNDCDTLTDETDWPNKGQVCIVGVGECLRTGVFICDASSPGGPTVCSVQQGAETTEVCDGLDNDCDGQTDEGLLWAPKGNICTVGTGACQANGVYVCDTANPSGPLVCTAVENPAGAEICNGVDDDCDSATDEELVPESCAEQRGVCSGSVRACAGTAGWQTCTGPEYGADWEPVELACDGKDNDCDGATDEALAPPPCEEQRGVCRGSEKVCGGIDSWLACTPAEYGADYESPEVTCDFLDNDCNGQTDELFRDPATGRYVGLENCGTCGNSCIGAIPNAVARCNGALTTPLCQVDYCLPGFYQVGTTTCLPATDTECQPCNTDANCVVPGNVCLDLDGGRFCGRQCDENNPYGTAPGECPNGYVCQAIGGGLPDQCVPATGSCTCLDGEDEGDTRPCSRTSSFGTCTGFEACDIAAGGWQPCDARTPSLETCNGVDDDCDTYVDEDVVPPPPEDCFVQNAEGICTGDWECHGIDEWFCNAATPIAELCDGADNDCDDAVDETFRDPATGIYNDYFNCGVCGFSCDGAVLNALTTECEIRGTSAVCVPVQCEEGYFIPANNDRVCMPEGVGVDCQPCGDASQCAGLPGADCEAIDDGFYCTRSCTLPADCPADYDCVGGRCLPHSGSCTCLPGQGGDSRPCAVSNANGTCTGLQVCDPAQSPGWSACDAQVPAAEICNGIDDDCNSVTDEGVTPPDPNCTIDNEFGSCPGTLACLEQGGITDWVCVGDTPTAEVCDGLDNDCSGDTDEPFTDLLETCFVSDGICRRFGFRECLADGSATYCNADPGPSETEICDGLDNDCDGFTDEDAQWSDKGEVCTSGLGICQRPGVKICDTLDRTGPTVCSAQPGPSETEICDGLDNDCNGSTDELPQWANKGEPCSAGQGACTASGVYICNTIDTAGATVCNAQEGTAGSEICNALDDDCDGLTDEDLVPESCAEQRGVCQGSTRLCGGIDGWLPCTGLRYGADYEATELSCDGLDNDCDGLTDEGLAAPPCDEQRGVCRGSRKVCGGASDWLACTAAEYGPAYEMAESTCDYLDNDCNGVTDDGFLVGGLYVDDANCGSCGHDCANEIPNGSGTCAGDPPRCVVASCDPGYVALDEFQCVPVTSGLCTPCINDASCPVVGARCATLDDGDFCVNPCSTGPDCPAGYDCTDLGGTTFCVPTSNDCLCNAGTLGLTKGCTEQYPPTGTPEYLCNGIETCGAAGWSPCLLPDESCNSIDDDCDGDTDEGFVDIDGRYTSDENCGDCGNDCTGIAYPGGFGYCDAVIDPPRCRVTCGPNCFDVNGIPTDGCECCNPEPDDFPDPLGVDANCDGIDGDLNKAIFVSKDGDDANDGSFGSPKLTIQAGIDAAAIDPTKRDVLVATGAYVESIDLATGVAVYGGYSSDFSFRDALLYEVAIFAEAPVAGAPGAVNAIGIAGGAAGTTVLDGFSVYGYEERTPGASSYAIYVRNSDATLTLTRNRVHGGSGGPGSRGTDGIAGADAPSGTEGLESVDLWFDYAVPIDRDDCDSTYWRDGGPGGSFTCGGLDTSGGNGGNRVCPVYPYDDPILGTVTKPPVASEEGTDGADGGIVGGAGTGGGAGWDAWHQSYSCDGYTRYGDVEGKEGTDGAHGFDGAAGLGCTDLVGTVDGTTGLWMPSAGFPGSDGTAGSGGGGGGSGGGAAVHQSCFAKQYGYDNIGGTGGGGGAGACAGTAGTEGTGGGGTFGIFVLFDSVPASVPTIDANWIFGGAGGDGGSGGNAGVGGTGGSGALGGIGGGTGEELDRTDRLYYTYPSFKGGKGGNGGNGGQGGGGGGGCGGPSYGIFAWPANTPGILPWGDDNTQAALGLGGSGGLGGFSLANPGGTGADGSTAFTNF